MKNIYGMEVIESPPPNPTCPKCGKELRDDTVYITSYRCECGWSGYYTDLKPENYVKVNEYFAAQREFCDEFDRRKAEANEKRWSVM